MKTYIDPMNGWKYGFPAVLPEGMTARELLENKGYPKDQIDFALQYVRQWEEEDED